MAATADNVTNITAGVRTGLIDGGTSDYKFQSRETITAESTLLSQLLTIKHSDEVVDNFDAGEDVDMEDDRKVNNDCSRFMKRNYDLSYSGDEQIYLENLDVDLEKGL